MIEALLKAGADANSVKANGTTALMIAAASGSADAVKVLLDHGANVNAKESAHGQTALMFAAALNRDAVIKCAAGARRGRQRRPQSTKLERVRFDQDGNIVEERPGCGAAAAEAWRATWRGAERRTQLKLPQPSEADAKADEATMPQAAATQPRPPTKRRRPTRYAQRMHRH